MLTKTVAACRANKSIAKNLLTLNKAAFHSSAPMNEIVSDIGVPTFC